MKKIASVVLIVAVMFIAPSCAMHYGLHRNVNNNITNVVLDRKNYKIIQKVKGSSSALSVLGIGGAFTPLVEAARSKMLEKADLIGSSRAVIHETVEVNYKNYVGVVDVKTVTVSAYVIEFTE